MSLTDREILEMNELCSALVDGSLTDAQRARLSQWLASSEEARRFYVRYVSMSASLCAYAGEMQVEAPDVAREPTDVVRPLVWRWAFASLAAAATVIVGFWVLSESQREEIAELNAEEFVARLTGTKDCKWTGQAAVLQPGDHLRRGQQLELLSGVAEITFDCGAQVVLEGPALLDLDSAWAARLRRGTLRANVPPEAIGFRVSNPAVEVVDLGTEFGMVVDEHGAAEVFVLKGSVEASAGGSREPLVLREKEARRFSKQGISNVRDRERKFARLKQQVTLERLAKPPGYVHWSFDEEGGDVVRAEVIGLPQGEFDARLMAAPETARVNGPWQRALRFDGQSAAKAMFPGISANIARTVAFWVKVSPDVSLTDGCAMVAWRARPAGKSGARLVQVGWNRNPEQGALGALRTECNHDFVVGSTPLRDNRWHHVAVVFVPGSRPEKVVHVQQYVDGRLEGTTSSRSKQRRAATAQRGKESGESPQDTVWLGGRFSSSRQSSDRFRGELDELFIVDAALAPQEIKYLMKENKPLLPDVVAVKSPVR